MTKQIQDVLTGGLPRIIRDESIPKFLQVSSPVLGGNLRARRFEPELTKKIRQKLLAAGCRSHEYSVTAHGRYMATKICQIALVPMDSAKLLFPGPKGRTQLEVLSDGELQELAILIIAQNKVFGEVPIEGETDFGPDDDTELDD